MSGFLDAFTSSKENANFAPYIRVQEIKLEMLSHPNYSTGTLKVSPFSMILQVYNLNY